MAAILKVRNFLGVQTVLEQFGVATEAILDDVGLPRDLFGNRDAFVFYADVDRLVAAASRACGCDDFGFRVGRLQDATAIGLAGLLSLHALKVHEALSIIASGLRASDTGGIFAAESRDGLAALSYVVAEPGIEKADHFVDASIAIIHNMMRQLCGPAFRPELVALPRSRPRDVPSFEQFFGAQVEFGASSGRLICAASWLDRKLANHNPQYIDILTPLLRAEIQARAPDLISTVKAVLKAQAAGGRLTRARAAAAMGLSEHVLAARLAEAGARFSDLAEATKYELARDLLAAGREQSAIAAELGFADASAFNRAFVKWSGVTPGRWRARAFV